MTAFSLEYSRPWREDRYPILTPKSISVLSGLRFQKFYEKLVESDVLPKTSQITPYRYEQTYKKYVNDGYEIIVITLSSKLSATYNSALQASKKI